MSDNTFLVELTADVVASHLSNNSVAVGDVPNLIRQIHQALSGLGEPAPLSEAKQERTPAVSVRSSIKPDYLVCLECGKKQKTLKRHVQNAHGMTPAEYRAAYGLKSDYPMVAPNYSERRSEMARSIGLGQKRKKQDDGAPPASGDTGAKPKAKGRPRKQTAPE